MVAEIKRSALKREPDSAKVSPKVSSSGYPSGYPKVMAHRGGGTYAPENTLAAFRLGAIHGVEGFECDVKLSADGELFLHHDATLPRTTNGVGLAGDKVWAELSKLDAGSWHSPEYMGEPLMRIRPLIKYCFANNLYLDIELKPNEGEAFQTGQKMAELLLEMTSDESGNLPKKGLIFFSSFEPEALRGALSIAPEIPRGLLVDEWYAEVPEILTELQCAGLITNYKILTDEMIAENHAQQRFVMVYTPNEPEELTALLARGVDAVITDNLPFIANYHGIEINHAMQSLIKYPKKRP